MTALSRTVNYRPHGIMFRQRLTLAGVAAVTLPGKTTLVELLFLLAWKGVVLEWQVGDQAPPVLSLLVLLALCDRG